MFERLPPSRRFFIYTCIFLAGIFGIFVFISSGISNLQTKKYVIYFDKSVSGLKKGNSVYFKGVPIGMVDSINIDLPSGNKVKVIIKIEKKMVLYHGCRAKLGMQGLTGHSILDLNHNYNEDMRVLSGHLPEIPSEHSAIEKLFDNVPKLIVNANVFLESLNTLIGKNKKNFGKALESAVNTFDIMAKAFVELEESSKILNRAGVRFEKNMLPYLEKASQDFSVLMKTLAYFTQSSSIDLMELLNNANKISYELNLSLEEKRGYLSYILGN